MQRKDSDALTHYLFASGTAHTASMFAVFLGVGLTLGLPGVPLTVFLGAIPTLMGCLTHYGNGPAPLYFGSGYVELGTWWRTGLVLGVVHMRHKFIVPEEMEDAERIKAGVFKDGKLQEAELKPKALFPLASTTWGLSWI